MRRLLIAIVASLAFPAAAAAHPLGNFTINGYSGIVLSGDRVYVRFVLDVAEIPTLQEGKRIRAAGFARSLAARLDLRLDGRRAPLRVLDSAVRERPGAAGLKTLRFEAVYETAARGATRLAYRDRAFENRRGWREVVVTAGHGATIVASTAPAESRSRMLTAYPRDLLTEPLAVDAATVSFRPGSLPGDPPAVGELGPAERKSSGFESLVSRDLTPGFVLVSLALALFWGAAHALGPGHGKAIVAGYLVGSRGKPRHALLLGLIVTVTHTIGVFTLGLVTLALSAFLVPDQLYPWLNLVSAVLVVAVGLGVLRSRLRERVHARAHARGHAHDHDDDHHEHDLRGLLGVGISGGLLPCPTALVVLLAAISLHRVGYGLALVVAFSVGLAASISAIGLIAVTARRAFARMRMDGPLIRLLPSASAAAVLLLGVAMTVRALPAVT